MKKIILLVLIVSCGQKSAGKKLPPDFVVNETPRASTPVEEAESNYKTIIRGQEEALASMKDSPGSWQMREMITDIAVAKTGLLGLSALRSNNGVEIKWARRTLLDFSPAEKTDLVIDENMDVSQATTAIADLASATGKIKVTPKLRARIRESLVQVEKLVNEVGASSLGNWAFKGVRFDLNFSVNGEVFFFAKAGPNLRLRMEWNHAKRPVKSGTPGSRFILKTLGVLNQVNQEIYLPGFTAKQLSLGVGTTYKGQLGIWKYSTGFLGFLLFTPVSSKSLHSLPSKRDQETFLLGGFEEKGSGTRVLSAERFVAGLKKSLATAAFFADAAASTKGEWFVKEIKTVNDISYTGLFGLADYTTRGAMEIDFKRNN